MDLAAEFCRGKVVFVLEGGYDPQNVANGGQAVFAALSGSKHLRKGIASLDPSPRPEPEIESSLVDIREWHELK